MSEIIKKEQGQVEAAPQNQGDTITALLREVALNPDIDVTKLQQVWEMQKDFMKEQSKVDFNRALNAAQAEIEPVYKDATNGHTRAKYATLEMVAKTIKPALVKHGLSTSFGMAESNIEGYFRVTCSLMHSNGFERDYFIDVPADGGGAKGGANKNGVQAVGSSMSYARRYLLMMIFDLATSDDDDAQIHTARVVSNGEAAQLNGLISQSKADYQKFLEAFGATSIDNFPKAKFSQAVKMLNSKIKQQGATQ